MSVYFGDLKEGDEITLFDNFTGEIENCIIQHIEKYELIDEATFLISRSSEGHEKGHTFTHTEISRKFRTVDGQYISLRR